MPNFDVATLQILTVLFPGLLGSLVFSNLRATRHAAFWAAMIEFFVFAFLSYAIASAIVDSSWTAGSVQGVSTVGDTVPQDVSVIDWGEFLLACAVAIVLAILAAVFYNHKLLNRIARFLRITSSYGDEDVWEFMHNSPTVEWVYLRDRDANVVYYGKIKNFSDSYKPREILLVDVDVYPYDQATGEPIDHLDAVYVSRPADGWTIEIPQLSNALPDSIPAEIRDQAAQIAGKRDLKALDKYYPLSEGEPRALFDTSRRISVASSKRLQRLLTQASSRTNLKP